MSLLKPVKSQSAESADSGRRSFFWKLGAGVSTALASSAGLAGTGSGDAESLSLQLALLEDEKALRKLHLAFEEALDSGQHDAVVSLFADDAEVVFNGGVFRNRGKGISRLFRGRFKSRKTGKRIEPAPGFEIAADQRQDSVTVAADRLTASAVFPYSIQAGAPLETESSLAGMARLHGEGVQTWWEGGVYDVSYRRDDTAGRWQIARLEYRTLSRADYRPGRSYARPIAVERIAALFPEDPLGPDALI